METEGLTMKQFNVHVDLTEFEPEDRDRIHIIVTGVLENYYHSVVSTDLRLHDYAISSKRETSESYDVLVIDVQCSTSFVQFIKILWNLPSIGLIGAWSMFTPNEVEAQFMCNDVVSQCKKYPMLKNTSPSQFFNELDKILQH